MTNRYELRLTGEGGQHFTAPPEVPGPSSYELRLSGEGGQGLVLAGKILAEAAAIYDEKNATQSQSYGPEARGGASKSEVIISDGEIDYPKAENLDLLLALTQEAFDNYHEDLREGAFSSSTPKR